MAADIGCIVGQRSESESVFVDVAGFGNERRDKITAADVMDEIAEKAASERVIAHVLDKAAAVGVRVRGAQILSGCAGVLPQEHRSDLVSPQQINNLFVRQH